MVPIELSLSNFLSYGEEVQTLDFTRFHVACLSGRNGQGKSALLDAITWVLWGEARKSSGGHKPDEELLRIGSRRMKVEFLFETEGARYRAMRAYSRSATGKTSKTELELQLLDEASGEGRPLTGASIRETQVQLNELLGLDYQTFINSAFLLQGRSDEFTKKKPSERKQILGRILNLAKYDRLAVLARDRQKRIADDIEQGDREIERLTAALASENEWKTLHAEVGTSLEAEETSLQKVRSEEAKLVEESGILDALKREAALHQEALTRLADQRKRIEDEQRQQADRIAKAGELIWQKEQIEAEFECYNAIYQEREDLDRKRDVYRGIEKLLDLRKNELQQQRFEHGQKMQQLEKEVRALKESLQEAEKILEGKVETEERLTSARDSAERVARLRTRIEERNRRQERAASIEKSIARQHDSLRGRLKGMEEQHAARKKNRPDIDALHRQHEQFMKERERMQSLELRKEEVKKQGQGVSETIKTIEGEMRVRQEEREKVRAHFEHLAASTASTCPTCGSELTEAHRLEVQARLGSELETIDAQLASYGLECEQHETLRQQLRDDYARLQTEETAAGDPARRLAQIEEKISAAGAELEGMAQLETEAQALRELLEAKRYAEEEQEQLAQVMAELDGLGIDEEALRKDDYEAAQVIRYEEQLRHIRSAQNRREKLQAQIAIQDRQLIGMRRVVDAGELAVTLQETIRQLQERMQAVGFDPERFEAVRRELRALAEAPNRMKDLLNAREKMSEWETQQHQGSRQLEELKEDERQIREKSEALAKRLEEHATLEPKLDAIRTEREKLEKGLRALQVQQGELSARLEQAQKDRVSLRETRKFQKEARSAHNLYGKLRRAFGRDGIPSLIIEQTLPEIEAKANELLERLTEGKMNVRLETLRDKKTGGTKETLEIIITDEQGVPRPYETFSGGEAFRVNFALRIALSQLLAERNGVKIRTLGIDEGFGTQDEQGIQNMIEAIQVIQDDFDKILVITHLSRLKEAFPVRIEVEKDPVMGSQFMVIEG